MSFAVADVENTVASLREHEVEFEEYDLRSFKTENGIAAIGNVKAAWFKDPEGNLLAITSSVEAMKAAAT